MWRAFWDFALKAIQLALAFVLNQLTFYVLSPNDFVMARQALATHDWLNTFWAPFMVRWQHGSDEVPFRVLLQVGSMLALLGAALSLPPLLRLSSADINLALVLVAASIYAAYKRYSQAISVHFVTEGRVRDSVLFTTRLGLLELACVGLAALVVGLPLPVFVRFGVTGLLLAVPVTARASSFGFHVADGFRNASMMQLATHLGRNFWLLLHNLALSSYFYFVQVVVPQQHPMGDDASMYQFIVSWLPIVSGVLFSYTEFLRPAVFSWAKDGVAFPWRRTTLFATMFVLAGFGYVFVGFPILTHTSALQDSSQEHFTLWTTTGVGASVVALAYLFDLALVAKHAYRRLALISSAAAVGSIACSAFPGVPIPVLLLVFPVGRFTLLALSTLQSRHNGH